MRGPPSNAAQTERRAPWLPLAGVIAAISVYAIAQGLTYPLLSLILARQGHSASDDRSLRRDDADRLHLLRAARPDHHPAASAPSLTVLASAFLGAAILAADRC